jgi:hypothetical protein
MGRRSFDEADSEPTQPHDLSGLFGDPTEASTARGPAARWSSLSRHERIEGETTAAFEHCAKSGLDAHPIIISAEGEHLRVRCYRAKVVRGPQRRFHRSRASEWILEREELHVLAADPLRVDVLYEPYSGRAMVRLAAPDGLGFAWSSESRERSLAAFYLPMFGFRDQVVFEACLFDGITGQGLVFWEPAGERIDRHLEERLLARLMA